MAYAFGDTIRMPQYLGTTDLLANALMQGLLQRWQDIMHQQAIDKLREQYGLKPRLVVDQDGRLRIEWAPSESLEDRFVKVAELIRRTGVPVTNIGLSKEGNITVSGDLGSYLEALKQQEMLNKKDGFSWWPFGKKAEADTIPLVRDPYQQAASLTGDLMQQQNRSLINAYNQAPSPQIKVTPRTVEPEIIIDRKALRKAIRNKKKKVMRIKVRTPEGSIMTMPLDEYERNKEELNKGGVFAIETKKKETILPELKGWF